MALFEVEWAARGTATVEADDLDEAEQLVTEGLRYFDTSQFESFDVDDTEILSDTTDDDED